MQTPFSPQEQQQMQQLLRETTVQQLVARKGRLVEVPYTASVGDTLHTMLAHNIVAVAVAAPPGHWVGAGGSMIVEADRATGAARKQYIGIVSAMDVLFHLADLHCGGPPDVASLLPGTRVSTIIGRCLEGLSLWAITPEASVMDAMDPMSKGLHRVLVPLESHAEHISAPDSGIFSNLESEKSAPSYRMFTQTDVLQFLESRLEVLHPILSQRVDALGVIQQQIFGVPASMTLIDTIKSMRQASLTAVPVVDTVSCQQDANVACLMPQQPEELKLVPASGQRIVATFSASDLRGCTVESFQESAQEGVLLFLRRAHAVRKFGVGGAIFGAHQSAAEIVGNTTLCEMPLVTCYPSSTLEFVIHSALKQRVHRVWVVDEQINGQPILKGLISFTDILRVVKDWVAAMSE